MGAADQSSASESQFISPALLRHCKLHYLSQLRFPPDVEAAFATSRSQFGQSVRNALLVFTACSVGLAPFASILANAPQALVGVGLPLQLLLMLPMVLLTLFFNVRPGFRKAGDLSMLLLGPVLIVGVLIQRVMGANMGFDVPLEYTTLIIASFFFLGHLRFWQFLPVAVGMLFMTLAVEVLWVDAEEPAVYRMLVNCSIIVMGIFGGYSLEYVLRDAWLNRQMLAQLSGLDPLTGLLNQRGLEEAMDRNIRRAQRDAACLSVAIIDIDYFKAYNDLFGREAGDAAIERIAGLLTASARRPLDFAARLGGEEFLMVWYDPSPDHAEYQASDLLEKIEEMEIRHAASRVSPYLTASAGLLKVAPARRLPPAAELLRQAESLLDQAKARGRNQCISLDTA
jgi:diguanylate cyclase (GGDEF)-like protein